MKKTIGFIVVIVFALACFFVAYYSKKNRSEDVVSDQDIAYDYDNMPEETTHDDLNIELDIGPGEAESFDEHESEAEEREGENPKALKTEIRVSLGGIPDCFDPARVSTSAECSYVLHSFEGLMKHTALKDKDKIRGTKVVFGQAKDYEVSEDGLKYTFYLRDDIFWTDGKAVTADDFVYSWRRLVSPDNDGYYSTYLNGIVTNASAIHKGNREPEKLGIKALDSKTLEIELEKKCPYFLRMCAAACLCPVRESFRTFIFGNGDRIDSKNIVTNGAFSIEEISDTGIMMKSAERYYNASNISCDSVFFGFDDKVDATYKYARGEYDLITDISGGHKEEIIASDEYVLQDTADSNFLIFNLSNVRDWRIRAAICLCLDREKLAGDVFEGHAVPLWSLVPPGISDHSKKSFENGYEIPPMDGGFTDVFGFEDAATTGYEDKRALAQKLKEKSVSEGNFKESATLRYVYNINYINMLVASNIKDQLEETLGIGVELVGMSDEDYVRALSKHDFDIARFNWSAEYDDASSYLDIFDTDGYYNYGNFYGYEPEYYLRYAGDLPAGSSRDEVLRMCEASMFTQYYFGFVPLYSVREDCAVKEDVTGVYGDLFGEYFFMFASKISEGQVMP
ncbi:MAG: peptide ABC transporter substrate-binding protein [Lachnospiraceae bacterium]|nr:peptide ABC transporter substrate-binding protein [Lachnospiraceae bacterium]